MGLKNNHLFFFIFFKKNVECKGKTYMDIVKAFFDEKPDAVARRTKRIIRNGPVVNTQARITVAKRNITPFPICVVWLEKEQQLAREGHAMLHYNKRLLLWKSSLERAIQRKPDLVVKGEVMFLVNPHMDANIGHALSAMLFALQYRAMRRPKCKVLVNNHKSQNMWDVLDLYVDRDSVITFEEGQTVLCKRLHIPPNHFLSLNTIEGKHLAENLMARIHVHPEGRARGDEPSLVVLCKLPKHSDAARPSSGVLHPDLQAQLESFGWVIIDPAETHLFRIAVILSRCRACIFGSGAINYAHRRFLGPQAAMIVLFREHSYMPGDRVCVFEDEPFQRVLHVGQREKDWDQPEFLDRIARVGKLIAEEKFSFGDIRMQRAPNPIQLLPPKYPDH